MVDKLHDYQGVAGRLHSAKDQIKEGIDAWRETHPGGISCLSVNSQKTPKLEKTLDDYPHVYRRKTNAELLRVSAAVMGIEFSYAAETAFVSPTLLKIGVDHNLMTLVWALSPTIGFLLTPFLGSLSDGCRLSWGRRRPFILLLSVGLFLGLLLVPNGQDLGHLLGDYYPSLDMNMTMTSGNYTNMTGAGVSDGPSVHDVDYPHPWGILFTVVGTALLDFNADSCQSPARAYLLDVCVPKDHAKGLSTFTVMAGLGGFFGYSMGAIDWDATSIGEALGGHVRAVFTLITIMFIICLVATMTSFEEIPLELIERNRELHDKMMKEASSELETNKIVSGTENAKSYGAAEVPVPGEPVGVAHEEIPSLKEYLLSIVFMPMSLRLLCLTNLFCWMAHVCYSLYFTDFVGESVFGGDPQAPPDSEEWARYEEGVRFGCWGMAMYSLSCSVYSLIIERLIRKFKAKPVYIGGLVFYAVGMCIMALCQSRVAVIVLSAAAGVIYSTLFTLPYLLVARYHATGIFATNAQGEASGEATRRGLGTDVAVVSSMVFPAQFILSMFMGSLITWTGTTAAVVGVASFLAFCGGISAFFIEYVDL